MTMMHITEALDGWLDELERRRKRFDGLSKEQSTVLHKQDAVERFQVWIQDAGRWARANRRDAFVSWLDANYPFLEEYVDELWQQVKR